MGMNHFVSVKLDIKNVNLLFLKIDFIPFKSNCRTKHVYLHKKWDSSRFSKKAATLKKKI